MALTFKNFTDVPPGMYWFLTETGQRVPPSEQGYYGFNDLEEAVARHYRANAKVVPNDLRQRIIDQMCQHLPDGWCRDGNRLISYGVNFQNEFNRVLQGTTTLVDWFLHGRQRVEQSEANTRAATCATCIFNQPVVGCTSCNLKTVQALVSQVAGGRTTPHDAALHACQICGCDLKAKVHLPLEVLQRHIPEKQASQYPPAHDAFPGCWLRK